MSRQWVKPSLRATPNDALLSRSTMQTSRSSPHWSNAWRTAAAPPSVASPRPQWARPRRQPTSTSPVSAGRLGCDRPTKPTSSPLSRSSAIHRPNGSRSHWSRIDRRRRSLAARVSGPLADTNRATSGSALIAANASASDGRGNRRTRRAVSTRIFPSVRLGAGLYGLFIYQDILALTYLALHLLMHERPALSAGLSRLLCGWTHPDPPHLVGAAPPP